MYENNIFDCCCIDDANYTKFFLKNFFWGNNYYNQINIINEAVRKQFLKTEKFTETLEDRLFANMTNIPFFYVTNLVDNKYYPEKDQDFMVFPKSVLSPYLKTRVVDDTFGLSKTCFSNYKFKYSRNGKQYDNGPFGVGNLGSIKICAASIADYNMEVHQCLLLMLTNNNVAADPVFYVFYYDSNNHDVYTNHFDLESKTILSNRFSDSSSELSQMWSQDKFRIYKCSEPFISDYDIQILRALNWIITRSQIEYSVGPTSTPNYIHDQLVKQNPSENWDSIYEKFPMLDTEFVHKICDCNDSWWLQIYFKCINRCLLNIIKDTQENKYNNTFLSDGWISSKYALFPAFIKNNSKENIFNSNYTFRIGNYFYQHFDKYH